MRNIHIIVLGIFFCLVFNSQALAEKKTFTCTCLGSVVSEAGSLTIYSKACGGGYTGGSKGNIKNNVTGEMLKLYIDPHGVLELVQEGLIVHYSKTSGWQCRRKP